METNNVLLHERIRAKSQELGLWEEALVCALDFLSQNRNLVNALDNKTEMDEYIYRYIIKSAIEKRRRESEKNLESPEHGVRLQAEKDLSVLSREELFTDPYYRAILPIIAKIVVNEPFLRLHADEASDIIIKLADFKRRHRATTVTEVIVTRCRAELDEFTNPKDILESDLAI
jgi:hypothetical protein